MKKWIGIALAASLFLAGFAVVSPVYAQSGSTETGMPGGPWGGPGRGPGGMGQPEDAPEWGLMQDYLLQYLADTYGLDIEAAKARLAEGDRLSEILLDAGVEDVPQAMLDARKYAFDQLEAEGYGPARSDDEDGFFGRMLNGMRGRFGFFRDEDGGRFPRGNWEDGEPPYYNYDEDNCPMWDADNFPRAERQGRGGRR